MTSMLDKKDETIIEVLKHNSNLSTQQISKKTNIPITTVHNRIKKLEKSGIIMEYTILLDNKKIGKAIAAYVGVTINYNVPGQKINQAELARKIKTLDEVYEVYILTGGSDIMIKVLTKDISDLNEFVTVKLRNIPGVDKTQTSIILKEL